MNAAETNLPISKLPAIIITDNAAPLNNLDKPNTEKNAALPAINRADIPNQMWKFLDRSMLISWCYSSSNSTRFLILSNFSL